MFRPLVACVLSSLNDTLIMGSAGIRGPAELVGESTRWTRYRGKCAATSAAASDVAGSKAPHQYAHEVVDPTTAVSLRQLPKARCFVKAGRETSTSLSTRSNCDSTFRAGLEMQAATRAAPEPSPRAAEFDKSNRSWRRGSSCAWK